MYLRRLFYHKLNRLGPSLQSYVHLQLCITLISWPFLYAWGLPITPATLIGILLFAPFLLIFLLLSSALFFFELLSLPHLPAPLLEAFTSLWWYTLTTSNKSWIFLFTHPPQWWIILIPIITGILLCLRIAQSLRIKLFLLLMIVSGILLPRTKRLSLTKLNYFDKELTLLQSGTQGILIDEDIILGRRLSAQKQITFTLIPHLIKNGITSLTVIVAKPSIMVIKALNTLVESFPVQAIYLPSFTGTLKNTGWHSWEELLKKAQRYQTNIISVNKPYTVSLSSTVITITPANKLTSKNNLTYHQLTQRISKASS